MKRPFHKDFKSIHRTCTLLLLGLACCLQFNVNGQTRIEIPVDSTWSRTLIEELVILDDEQGIWSAESLFRISDSQFKPNQSDSRPSLHNYWAKFELANSNNREQWVSFESFYWDYVKLYLRDSVGDVTVVPFGILSNPYNNKFLVKPNSTYEVLVNFESSGKFRREDNLNLVIKSTLPHLESETFTNYMDGITFGIMFGLALYNLFLFISLRDRTYFWYSLYILSFALSYMSLFSSQPPHWTQYFSSKNPLVAFYVKKITDPLVWISYINFVRNFLVTKKRHPDWDKILIVCIGALIVQFLINLTGIYHFTGVLRSLSYNIPVMICVIIAIISYVQGHSRARFFLLGQIFLVAGVAITATFYAGWDVIFYLPQNEFFNYFRSPNSIFVFGAAESIVFSFALADKYNILQKDIARVKIEKEREKQEMLASQNEVLEQQVEGRTQELRQSLADLKTAQAQLIQAEKMASLGTLTAGIAHEIRNPLNFINNFSEINCELVEQLLCDEENDLTANMDDTDLQTLHYLKKNSEKIHRHGKRMDAIVKGMLHHSRDGPSQYEEVDINALCDEALRIAYNGYRAKEKSFSANYETIFATDLPRVHVLTQDLRRVILNIINNAFYAVNEKRKMLVNQSDTSREYQPGIKLSTAESLQDISITIADNGSGIPKDILDKIFQPFFTTKPTGDGTGLGLSLSYDIITKGHGGELKVRSKEGLGTEFEILLPLSRNNKRPTIFHENME